ncbi:hypothetical protein [Oleiagrimonas soli]|uniref:Uncharacterized protein n=1 Tax=Oleiagrimonas soli TaxID=1543381 RepID=A0A841KCY0_9GAMM|nr:hypothetical protein [Oleiagrimonas soli]MBB6182755.1 hypothetical protein [Oleiagrimonas soli]
MTASRSLSLFLVAFLSLFSVCTTVHAQSMPKPAPLEERMSHAEFMRLGLDKLSPAQLKALNVWLQTHGERGPSMDDYVPRSARAAGDDMGDADIHSSIVGAFRGWDAYTVFTLANGQHWKVSEDSQMTMRSIDNPKVTLRKGFLGSWLLSVDGSRESVRVSRVK